jgi:hypothetical protein
MDDPRPAPSHVRMKAEVGTYFISPYGFHRHGSEFVAAARAVDFESKFSPVPYYLYCHGIELLLKAFLLVRGVPKPYLKKKFGHNLEAALRQAEDLGLRAAVPIGARERAELLKANAYYMDKGFEYFDVGSAVTRYQDLPDLPTLDAVAGRLIDGLRQICLDAALA